MAFAGRLRWLDSQIFGRRGRWAFRVILEHGTRPGRHRQLQLTSALKVALEWVLQHVPKAEPRAFKAPTSSSCQVFTDGSYEDGVGRLGGVLRSSSGEVTEWFQATVPGDIVQSWFNTGTSHPILQCELMAVSLAAAVWGAQLTDWPTIWWIDNDAARHCLISAKGYPDSNAKLVQTVLDCEEAFRIQSWFARVPSISNPADARLPAGRQQRSQSRWGVWPEVRCQASSCNRQLEGMRDGQSLAALNSRWQKWSFSLQTARSVFIRRLLTGGRPYLPRASR